MEQEIRILHIDPDYQGNLVTIQKGKLNQSPLSLEKTLDVVKKEQFHLIVSEPHHLAILPPGKMRLPSPNPKTP
ncbi:MAG: hypothetical protein MUF69_00220 [Desulfobacterota bacterium]|jgi:hypothetical protein|nr:hypothetical protein [Thermodesulfobacteriota bacterium]